MDDLISRQDAIDAIKSYWKSEASAIPKIIDFGTLADKCKIFKHDLEISKILDDLPSARPEYEPVKTEDFAKTMSENTLYSFMAWYGEALELMGRQGFVICKKTM